MSNKLPRPCEKAFVPLAIVLIATLTTFLGWCRELLRMWSMFGRLSPSQLIYIPVHMCLNAEAIAPQVLNWVDAVESHTQTGVAQV